MYTLWCESCHVYTVYTLCVYFLHTMCIFYFLHTMCILFIHNVVNHVHIVYTLCTLFTHFGVSHVFTVEEPHSTILSSV